MNKTTVYLPEELELRLDAESAATGASKAELIRRGITLLLEQSGKRRPIRPLPVFNSGRSKTVEEMDDALYAEIKERTERR